MRIWTHRICLLFLLPSLAHASGMDGDITQLLEACPGGQQWLAQKQAQTPAPASEVVASDPALREELLKRAKEDQQVRDAIVAGAALTPEQTRQWQELDRRNLQRLQQIVASQGFPDSRQVGRDGVGAAWLLLQHADSDPAFQSRMLTVLGTREDPALSKEQLALLTDRVLTAQNKPQRYGSQYEGVGADMKMRPVEAPVAALDARRAAMAMMPSATYECLLKQLYAPAGQMQTPPTE